MKLGGPLRIIASGLLVLGWITASHLGSIGVGPTDLHVAVAVAPFAAAVWILAARWPSVWWRLALALAFAALVWGLWPQLRTQVAFLYYLQHLGFHLALAALFGTSLRRGAEPLITRMARGLFGPQLTPAHARYTRHATLAWALFFLLNAGVSTVLFLVAPREWWSLHANVLTGPLVGVMFLAESLWRRVALPPGERPGLADVMQAWRRDAARRQAGRETSS